VKTSQPQWIVTSTEQGLRLDRFLAASDRLGSRGRVRTALERGQVFLNGIEASPKDAGSNLSSGDVVSPMLWRGKTGCADWNCRFSTRMRRCWS
jgi:ribosomal 50S subunit-recycling heat shock protein